MRYDAYLTKYFTDYLWTYEARCLKALKGKDQSVYHIFHDMHNDDLWNILLTREYDNYLAIKEVLPTLPSEDLQRALCGNCGAALSLQSCEFYKKVKDVFARVNGKPLNSTKVLDFGCGWGRLIRYFAKDVPEDHLYGCDPQEDILKVCRDLRIPAVFGHSDYRPKQLPFSEKFDLIYAYSVFTHLSEQVHTECLEVISDALAPNGIVILTIRPRSYITEKGGDLSKLSNRMIHNMAEHFDRGQFVFHPHNRMPIDGEITYGEAIIPYIYVRHNWTTRFDLISSKVFKSDPYQVLVILRRRQVRHSFFLRLRNWVIRTSNIEGKHCAKLGREASRNEQ